MALHFPFMQVRMHRPVYPLGGVKHRFYPVFAAIFSTPAGGIVRDALLDTGADDTILPADKAVALGIDLTDAPEGEARSFSGGILRYRYASVRIRLTDTRETCEWDATVGFVQRPLHWYVFGQTGFLQYFDVSLVNPFREIILTPNTSFTGQHIIH